MVSGGYGRLKGLLNTMVDDEMDRLRQVRQKHRVYPRDEYAELEEARSLF